MKSTIKTSIRINVNDLNKFEIYPDIYTETIISQILICEIELILLQLYNEDEKLDLVDYWNDDEEGKGPPTFLYDIFRLHYSLTEMSSVIEKIKSIEDITKTKNEKVIRIVDYIINWVPREGKNESENLNQLMKSMKKYLISVFKKEQTKLSFVDMTKYMIEQRDKIKEKLKHLNFYINVDDLIDQKVLLPKIRELKEKIYGRIKQLKENKNNADLMKEIIRNKDFHLFYSHLSTLKDKIEKNVFEPNHQLFEKEEVDEDIKYYNNLPNLTKSDKKSDYIYSFISKILRIPYFEHRVGIMKEVEEYGSKIEEIKSKPYSKKHLLELNDTEKKVLQDIHNFEENIEHFNNVIVTSPENEDHILKIIDRNIKQYKNLMIIIANKINENDYLDISDLELSNLSKYRRKKFDDEEIFSQYQNLLQFIVLKEDNRNHREKQLLFNYGVNIDENKKIIKTLNDIGISKIDLLDINLFIENSIENFQPNSAEIKNIGYVEKYVNSMNIKKKDEYLKILFKLTQKTEIKNFDIIGNLAKLSIEHSKEKSTQHQVEQKMERQVEQKMEKKSIKEKEELSSFIGKMESVSINCFEPTYKFGLKYERLSFEQLNLKLNKPYQEIFNYLNDFLPARALDPLLVLGILQSDEYIRIQCLLKYIEKFESKSIYKYQNKLEIEKILKDNNEIQIKLQMDLIVLKRFFIFLICEFEWRFRMSNRMSKSFNSKQQFFNWLIKKPLKEIIEKMDEILNRENFEPSAINIQEKEMKIESDFLKIGKLYYHSLGRYPGPIDIKLGLGKLEKFEFKTESNVIKFSVLASIKPIIIKETKKEIEYKFIHDYIEIQNDSLYSIKKILFRIIFSREFDQFLKEKRKFDGIKVISYLENDFSYEVTTEINKNTINQPTTTNTAILFFPIKNDDVVLKILSQFVNLIYQNSKLYDENKIFFIEILKSVLIQNNYVLNIDKYTKVEIVTFESETDEELLKLQKLNDTINKIKMENTNQAIICQEFINLDGDPKKKEENRIVDLIYQEFYTMERLHKSPIITSSFQSNQNINRPGINVVELFQFDKFQQLLNVLFYENYDLKKLISSGLFFELKEPKSINPTQNQPPNQISNETDAIISFFNTKENRKLEFYHRIYMKCLKTYIFALKILQIYYICVKKIIPEYKEEKEWLENRISTIKDNLYFKKYGNSYNFDNIYNSSLTYYFIVTLLNEQNERNKNITISNIVRSTWSLINVVFSQIIYEKKKTKRGFTYHTKPNLIYDFLNQFLKEEILNSTETIGIYKMLKKIIFLKDDYDDLLIELLVYSKDDKYIKNFYSELKSELELKDQEAIFSYHSLIHILSKILLNKLFNIKEEIKIPENYETILQDYKEAITNLLKDEKLEKSEKIKRIIYMEKKISMKRYYERMRKIIVDKTNELLIKIEEMDDILGDSYPIGNYLQPEEPTLDFYMEFDNNFYLEREKDENLIKANNKNDSLKYFYYWKFFENYIVKKFYIKFQDKFYEDQEIQKKQFEAVDKDIIKKYDANVRKIINDPPNILLKDYFINFCHLYELKQELLINFISWNLILLKPYKLKKVEGKGWGVFTKDKDIYIDKLNRIPNLIGFCIPKYFPRSDTIIKIIHLENKPQYIMIGPIKLLNSSLNNKCKLVFSTFDETSRDDKDTEKFFKNWEWCKGKIPGPLKIVEWVENTSTECIIKFREKTEILIKYEFEDFFYDDNNPLGYDCIKPKDLPTELKEEQYIIDKVISRSHEFTEDVKEVFDPNYPQRKKKKKKKGKEKKKEKINKNV
jgi:hypothetical protein